MTTHKIHTIGKDMQYIHTIVEDTKNQHNIDIRSTLASTHYDFVGTVLGQPKESTQ